MHKQYSRLVQVKARKRLGSDQLERNNNHKHALRLTHPAWKRQTVLVDSWPAQAYKAEFHLQVWSLAHANLLGTVGKYRI